MARWLRLATLLALCLHFCTAGILPEHHDKLPPCEDGWTCMIFTKDECTVKGEKIKPDQKLGYIWDGNTKCKKADYELLLARLDIELVSLTKWKVIATLMWDESTQKEEDVEFKLGDLSITFKENNKGVEIAWEKDGKSQMKAANTFNRNFESTWSGFCSSLTSWTGLTQDQKIKFNIYAFEIEANEEKLIKLMNGEVIFIGKRTETRTMKDPRFKDLLAQKPSGSCHLSEIKKICYDEPCDELANNGVDRVDAEFTCPSKLWMHSVDETMIRNWKKIDKIRCDNATWMADTITTTYTEADSEEDTHDSENVDSKTRRKREESEVTDPPKIATNTTDSKAIDHSYEVQCSSEEPAKITTTMKVILGFGISGVLVLIIAVVAGIVVCMLRRKKARENDFGTTKSHGGTTSKSKAGTPSGKAAH